MHLRLKHGILEYKPSSKRMSTDSRSPNNTPSPQAVFISSHLPASISISSVERNHSPFGLTSSLPSSASSSPTPVGTSDLVSLNNQYGVGTTNSSSSWNQYTTSQTSSPSPSIQQFINEPDSRTTSVPSNLQSTHRSSPPPLVDYPGRPTVSPVPQVAPKVDKNENARRAVDIMNLPILMCKVGQWQKVSTFCGDLISRFHFAEKKFSWEVFFATLIYKVEFPFSDVTGLGLHVLEDGTSLFTIELGVAPRIYGACFQPHKIMNWAHAGDFSGGYIQAYKRHTLHFGKGALNTPLDTLLRLEPRLAQLAQRGLVPHTDPFFPPVQPVQDSRSLGRAREGSENPTTVVRNINNFSIKTNKNGSVGQ